MGFKFKDLKKLSSSVQSMCAFAEEIKNHVHKDLEQIEETKTFITSITGQLKEMSQRSNESEKTLEGLKELLA